MGLKARWGKARWIKGRWVKERRVGERRVGERRVAERRAETRKAPAGYRFNRKRLYEALDARRRELTYRNEHFQERELSWREVGRQADVSEMTILRLREGMGPTMESYGRLCAWLGVGLDEFFE